jgi:hypothetical protein
MAGAGSKAADHAAAAVMLHLRVLPQPPPYWHSYCSTFAAQLLPFVELL